MKSKVWWSALVLLLICVPAAVHADDPEITFDTSYLASSYSIPYADSTAQVHVQFRELGQSAWRNATPPFYHSPSSSFRGHITNFSIGRTYEVKVEIRENGVLVHSFVEQTQTRDFADLNTPHSSAPGILTLVPTFHNISYYVPYEEVGAQAHVSFRAAGETDWLEAYPPYYDAELGEFRGSIVYLEEDTAYEVKADIYNGGQLVHTYSSNATTWKSDVAVAQTIPISQIYSGGQLIVDGYEGSPGGWIKIIGDGSTVIDAGESFTEAVIVANSQYLILEGLTIRGGLWEGVRVLHNAEHIRIINNDIAQWGQVGIQDPSNGQYFNENGVRVNNNASAIRIMDAANVVIERNYIHDSKGKNNAWRGPTWNNSHPSGPSGIFVMSRGGTVIRYNDIIGSDAYRWNDAIASNGNEYARGGLYRDGDIYGNMLAFGQDDGLELDGGQMNIRVYGNKVESFYVGMSTAPNILGPSYVYDNLIADLGDEFDRAGSSVKNGGGDTYTRGFTYFFGNTIYANTGGIYGVGFGTDSGDLRRKFYAVTRNNILVQTVNLNGIHDRLLTPVNDFDYDLLGNTVRPGGLGTITAVAGSQANGVRGLPDFANISNGDYRLLPGSLGLDSGTVLPNFTRGYSGSAPDMGAYQLGSEDLIPYRPITARVDKYKLNLTGAASETVILDPGAAVAPQAFANMQNNSRTPQPEQLAAKIPPNAVVSAQSFTILQNLDSDWFTVTASSNLLIPGIPVELTVTADPALFGETGRGRSAFIIKLDDGFSIPITVYADPEEDVQLGSVPIAASSANISTNGGGSGALSNPGLMGSSGLVIATGLLFFLMPAIRRTRETVRHRS